MFPTASILIRASYVLVKLVGIVTVAFPLLGTFNAKSVYVVPLSVETKIFTFTVLMLFAVVPPTFHVMVLVSPINQTASVVPGLLFGAVITNGPVVATVIVTGCV